MTHIIHKGILALLSLTVSMMFIPIETVVLGFLATVIFGVLMELVDNSFFLGICFFVYSVLSFWFPILVFFYPMICYRVFRSKQPFILIWIPVVLLYGFLTVDGIIIVLLLTMTSWVLRYTGDKSIQTEELLVYQRDDFTSNSLLLEQRVSELIIKQDNEVHMAVLKERDRISREIHDSIGHLLSSAMIQVGAIQVMTKEEGMGKQLNTLKETLAEGMNAVRHSVHDMRDESFDLYEQCKEIVNGFSFCEITFQYEVDRVLPLDIRYTVVAIMKEALSNVIRHSNGTLVEITIYSFPGILQMKIRDNGKNSKENSDGMGLENIRQRVQKQSGVVNINREDGFLIFISIPAPP